MDYTRLFYWLVVADNAKSLFVGGIILFTVITIASTIALLVSSRSGNYYESDIEKGKQAKDISVSKSWCFLGYPFLVIFWMLYVFTPSKKDSLLIVAGGGTLNFLTTDASAKQIPHELSNFVLTELKNMASESEIDLNIKSQKTKILEEAKSMTAEEVLNKIKTDSIYKKVLLETTTK
jgi:hypothetical protein